MDYSKLLEKIEPSTEDKERVKVTTEYVIQCLDHYTRNVEILPGGSSAKGTFLKGDFDVDIFARFKNYKENYSNELHTAIKKFCNQEKINYERVHGSRDYFQFEFKKISFEIVPVKYVNKLEEIENVTDMSPLHVSWAKDKLSDSLKRDILLAKQFCKAQRIYGAESFINGFSGHVIDILILHYKGFEKMLKAISKWGKTTVIDTEKKHEDVFKSLNKAKLQSPLIVVDPIDSSRNASASVSEENYQKFIAAAKDFLEKQKECFFKIPTFSKEKLEEKISENENLFVLEVVPLEGKSDVIGSKVLKVFTHLKKELKAYGFILNSSDWFFDRKLSNLYFYVPKEDIEKIYVRKGPKVDNKEGVENFKKKHGVIFEENGVACVKLEREFTSLEIYLKKLIEEEYVTSRVEGINLIV